MATVPARERRDATSIDAEQLVVARDLEGVAAIRDAWLELQGNAVTTDPDFFLAALAADPKIVRPHVVLLERDGRPTAMLVGRVENLELPMKVGYKKILSPVLPAIAVVTGGVLGEPDDATFRTLLQSLVRSLADGEADVCVLRHLPVESSWYRIALTEPSFWTRQHVPESGVHWALDLPDTFDEYRRSLSSGTRRGLKANENRLQRDFPGALEVRTFGDVSELDELMRDVEAIASKTYQRALGVAFGDTPRHRARTQAAMERGWFRAYVLYIDGRPVAFTYGERYRGVYRSGRPGHDPDLSSYSPGTYLLMRSIEAQCEDPEVDVFDLGIGDAEYKRRYCNRSWEEGTVTIVASRPRPVALNLARSALLRSVGAARKVIGKGALYHRLKRSSRKRMTADRGG